MIREYGMLFIKDDFIEINDGTGKVVLRIEKSQNSYYKWGFYIWDKCSVFDLCSNNGWNLLCKDSENKCYIVYKEVI